MKRHDHFFIQHIRENMTVYIFLTTLFFIGIIFGAIIVNGLSFIQKQDIYFQFENFLNSLMSGEVQGKSAILKQSFIFHMKVLAVLFLLGLTIIGIPIIWLIIFVKGIAIGFSVGFIVNQLGWQGLFISLFSIAPQNIIIVPVYIFAAGLSMIFSINIFRKIIGQYSSVPIGRPMMQYSIVYVFFGILAFVSTLLDAFVSNEMLKIVLKVGFVLLHID